MKIPLIDLGAQHQPLMKEINSSIKEIFENSSFIKGPTLQKFEKEFAKFIGTKYAVGVASGTDALHLSLMALGIGPGDEVIIPVNTFISTAYAALYVGAKPVFVDIDENTYNVDVNMIEDKITKRTRVIIPVHLYGTPAQMDKILSLAKKYNLIVIEDAAQAHGSCFKNKKAGTMGNLAAFSFYTSKNLGACGDAGAITTNSRKMADLLIRLRDFGRLSHTQYSEVGINSRLDTIQAAILSIKLNHLNRWNEKRRQVARYYHLKLEALNIPGLIVPQISKDCLPVYYVYTIRCKKRDKLAESLLSNGVQTGIYYPLPLHLQKSLKSLGYKKGDFPITETVSEEILSLPMYPELTHSQQDFVIKAIMDFYAKN